MTKPEQNGRHSEDNILKDICMKETFCNLQILQKFLEVQLTINHHQWDAITHSPSNLNDGLVKKTLLELGHGWVITFHKNITYTCLIPVKPYE